MTTRPATGGRCRRRGVRVVQLPVRGRVGRRRRTDRTAVGARPGAADGDGARRGPGRPGQRGPAAGRGPSPRRSASGSTRDGRSTRYSKPRVSKPPGMPWSALTSASDRARTHSSRSSSSTATSSGATPGSRTTTSQPSATSVSSTSGVPAAAADQPAQLGAQRLQFAHRVPALLAAPPAPADSGLLAHRASPIRWVAVVGRSELGASRPASAVDADAEPVDQLAAEPGADAEDRHRDHLDGDQRAAGGPRVGVEPDRPDGGEEQDHRDVRGGVQQTRPAWRGCRSGWPAGRTRRPPRPAGRRSGRR